MTPDVLARYETEFALTFGDTPTRIAAVRAAYFTHGFDVDLIAEFSGYPVWRVRQVILGGNPQRSPDEGVA